MKKEGHRLDFQQILHLKEQVKLLLRNEIIERILSIGRIGRIERIEKRTIK